jgi:signal transduction histidine kinase
VNSLSPLAQLLHALNQPLTALQCSMEVALARSRTPAQYAQGLREGLELTRRMRALVEAIREVVGVEEEGKDELEPETIDLKTLLREVLDDLEHVAAAMNVRITLDNPADSSEVVKAPRRRLAGVVFRFLESALTLAARDSLMRMETGGGAAEAWLRLQWHAEVTSSAGPRPELGLLVAQAGWERAGACWKRERTEDLETVTVRLPRVSAHGGSY